jgi:hypothetical protein
MVNSYNNHNHYNSDYANSFRASLRNQQMQQYQQYVQAPKPKPKWLLPAIIGLAVVILIVAVVIILSASGAIDDDTTSQEFLDNVYNDLDGAEELNEKFKSAVAKNEHNNYMTSTPETEYVTLTPDAVVGALGLGRSDLAKPATSSMLVKTTAMNSNAMDYYLDQGNIIVMIAKHEGETSTKTLVIYARSDFFYVAFEVAGTFQKTQFTRSDIFNNIEGVPDFYIMKGLD